MRLPGEGTTTRRLLVAAGAGLILGAAAGLIGVGGGEFRIPVLLLLLRLEVRTAAGVNLLVGLFTVSLAFARRAGHYPWSADDLLLAGTLIGASLAGSTLGARQAHRLPSRPLLMVVRFYLLAVGTWMIGEAVLGAEPLLIRPDGGARLALAGTLGFVIAAVSGALGVAGGEMRIPALIYLFGFGVKEAGTLSLLASIPTVAAGAVTYRRLGHLPDEAVRLALVMGAGSLAGVLAGTALLPAVDPHLIKGLLGLVLLLAAAGLGSSRVFLRGRDGRRPEGLEPRDRTETG